MIPIRDGHGDWTCTDCGQFILSKDWTWCPICGSRIDWVEVPEEEELPDG